jgi:hypothetical protein
MVTFSVDDLEHIGEIENAPRVVNGRELNCGIARRRTHFEADDVLAASGDNEVAGLGEDPQRNLVRHHA